MTEIVNTDVRTDGRLDLDPNQEVQFTAKSFESDKRATELGCTQKESVEKMYSDLSFIQRKLQIRDCKTSTVVTPNKGTPNKGKFPYLSQNPKNGK